MTTRLLLGLVLAQSATPAGPGSGDLRRIRQALEQPAPVSVLSAPVERDGTMFRLRIEAFELETIAPTLENPTGEGKRN